MKIIQSPITSLKKINNNSFLITVEIDEAEFECSPGQFFNIKVTENHFPLLRRPFSICDYQNGKLSFLFTLMGEGTKILASRKVGEKLDILGPLGNSFDITGDYTNAIIVAGGIGVAPFPLLYRKILKKKKIFTYLGGRTNEDLITYGLGNVITATDDGSSGFHGNVVELLETEIEKFNVDQSRIFACGPTPMLKAVQQFSVKYNIKSEISTESAMACGFGICQGCPTKASDRDGFYLICKDGPVFDSQKVIL